MEKDFFFWFPLLRTPHVTAPPAAHMMPIMATPNQTTFLLPMCPCPMPQGCPDLIVAALAEDPQSSFVLHRIFPVTKLLSSVRVTISAAAITATLLTDSC